MHSAMQDATRTPPDATPLSLSDAAVRLGISPDAARKRLERGTLHGEKRGGRWRVYLELDATADAGPDTKSDKTRPQRTPPDAEAAETQVITSAARELIDTLRSENGFLRSELEARTEEIRRRDHILAGLLQELSALQSLAPGAIIDAEEPVPEAPDSAHASVDVIEAPQSADTPHMTRRAWPGGEDAPLVPVVAQEPAWRSWLRRLFGV